MRIENIIFGPLAESLIGIANSLETRFIVIYDETLEEQRHAVIDLLGLASRTNVSFALPQGERAKDLQTLSSLWDFLGRESINRNDVLVALGGGSVTDVVGFAAATWMRGIRYINIPTSLLAMVDASIGGKTAINTSFGKNLVGSFHLPYAILIDTTFLNTLAQSEISNGLAEVVKCGFIHDPFILKLVEMNPRNYEELIQRSVRVKTHFVENDPQENLQGVREILNYGHTLGHALERVLEYQIGHGQAIVIGMHFAARLSCRLGYIAQDLVERHINVFNHIGLQTTISNVAWEQVAVFMQRDKKALSGKNRFILLKDLGVAEVVSGLDDQLLQETYQEVCS